MTPKSAVVLLSGGLDSATVLAYAQRQGFAVVAVTFRYGQRHTVEVEAAARVATARHVPHRVVDIDLAAIGGSALTDTTIAVPRYGTAEGIPATYVPARNTIFLSYALAYAEVLGAADIFIGVNAVDYSGYPDCRPEYIAAFEHMANLATKASVQDGRRVRIHAPLVLMTKAEIIRLGARLGVDYAQTHSCYQPHGEQACGICDSCQIRERAFAELDQVDPARA